MLKALFGVPDTLAAIGFNQASVIRHRVSCARTGRQSAISIVSEKGRSVELRHQVVNVVFAIKLPVNIMTVIFDHSI